MRISIFETEHFEVAYTVIKLFDTPNNCITIYTTPKLNVQLGNLFQNNKTRYNWIVLPIGSKLRFFYSLYKNLKQERPDILYLSTISNNHLLYASVLKLLSLKRVILTVHDINCLFESRPSWDLRKLIIHCGKKWLIKTVREFNVISETMVDYLQTKAKQKTVHNISGAVFDGHRESTFLNGELRVVIPGSLDQRRRNYEEVFELAAIAHIENLYIQIILLGGYSDQCGKNIVNRAEKFQSRFSRILSYHTEIVHQDEFDRQMNDAHFLFMPSVIYTEICRDIPEVYGKTKSSGNISDAIKYAKPFIVPAALTIPTNLETGCFRYNSITDVVRFLKSLAVSPELYDRWQRNATENSSHYTIKRVRRKNIELFGQV